MFKGGNNYFILLRQHRARIEQELLVINARDDRRVGLAQSGRQRIRRGDRQSQDFGGKGLAGQTAAPNG